MDIQAAGNEASFYTPVKGKDGRIRYKEIK